MRKPTRKDRLRRTSRVFSLAIALPVSLVALTGCDPATKQGILDILKSFNEQKQSGKKPSFVTSDPASLPQSGPQFPGVLQPTKDFDNGATDGKESDEGGDNKASKAIAEADLIQRQGDTLYALSETRGLTIIDIQNPQELEVLGEFVVDAPAFEMYVRDGIVMAMLRDVNSYAESSFEDDGDEGAYVEARNHSALMVLDASNPQDIKKLSQWAVPGRILDSRRVQDHLFVMSYETPGCWRCESNQPTVRVTSFDLRIPKSPVPQAELAMELPQHSWGAQPSLMSTGDHLYVAINDRRSKEGALSTIRAIDISNPSAMALAGEIPVSGSITNRWQMNEHNDVLRVITQPFFSLQSPEVQTFSVANINNPTSLGKLTMTLPRPEQLRAVRFDKDRAYAITFERTDPLFTLDLKDPANPVQRGELEIPGWVYHMEPRGERIIGIGFDRRHPEGSLNASLFDVSDMDKPTMLSRVHFGGNWANFAEQQNQIHKAFKIWDKAQLLAIPFSGSSAEPRIVNTPDGDRIECKQYRQRNGVALIDWKDDGLALRGMAETEGQAKRSLLHKDHLLAVSTQEVSSFDISNRDEPLQVSDVDIAVSAQKLIALPNGNWLRRRGNTPGELKVDIVAAGQENSVKVIGTLSYEAPLSADCFSRANFGEIFVHENFVYVELRSYSKFTKGQQGSNRELLAFDITNPQKPNFVSKSPFGAGVDMGLDFGIDGVSFGGKNLVQKGAFIFLAQAQKRDWKARQVSSQIIVYRLDGASVIEVERFDRPVARYAGPVELSGNGNVSSWYALPADKEDPSKITFHWQDFRTTQTRVWLQDVQLPGAPLLVSKGGRSVLALGFEARNVEGLTQGECFELPSVRSYDAKAQRCQLMDRTLYRIARLQGQTLVVGSEPLADETGYISNLAKTPSYMAFQVQPRYFYPGPWLPGPGLPEPVLEDSAQDPSSDDAEGVSESAAKMDFVRPYPMASGVTHVLSIGDATNLGRAKLPKVKGGYGQQLSFTQDNKLLRRNNKHFELFDLSNLGAPTATRYRPHNFVWGCSEPFLRDADILCAAGNYGVRRLEPIAPPALDQAE